MTNSERLFLVLAEELNFSHAAQKSYISQQCLSDHIKRLEESYRTPLFFRKPSVKLTPVGEAVQRTLQKVRMLEHGLDTEIEEIEHGARGTLTLGLNTTRAKIFIPPLFERFRERYPNVRLDLQIEETEDMEQMLLNGKLDFFLGVNTTAVAPMKVIPLAREEIFLAVSNRYLDNFAPVDGVQALQFGAEVDLTRFSGLPFTMNFAKSTLYQMVNQHCMAYDIQLDNVLSISDYDVQLALCRAGHTAAFFPQMMLPLILKENKNHPQDQQIRAFHIQNFHQPLRVDLICHELIHYPRYALDCFALLKELVEKNMDAIQIG